jgi:SAM-dependent methyltransferase
MGDVDKNGDAAVLRSAGRFVGKHWNWRLFLKHHVKPLLDWRERIPDDSCEMFAGSCGERFNDSLTSESWTDPLHRRYHYAGIEMAIIELLIFRGYQAAPAVLDIGTGTGHWIDFYLHNFSARSVVGVDIAEPIVAKTRGRFTHQPNVEILAADISHPDFDLGHQFNIINAIGVMFHIVEDDKWQQAIANMSRHLAPGGAMLVGGMFGLVTQDVQRAWAKDRRGAVVQKRIRSLAHWRFALERAGCYLIEVRRTRRSNIVFQETNVALINTGSVQIGTRISSS